MSADALDAARRACEQEDLGFFGWSLAELVEAAARSNADETAAEALQQLEQHARAAGTDWGLGVLARSRALLTVGPAADAFYREAIERLGRTGDGRGLTQRVQHHEVVNRAYPLLTSPRQTHDHEPPNAITAGCHQLAKLSATLQSAQRLPRMSGRHDLLEGAPK